MKPLLLRAVGSRCRPPPTAKKPAEQPHVAALVGEIGADTGKIGRDSATVRPGSASLTEAYTRVVTRASSATALSREGLRNRARLLLNLHRSR